MALLSGWRGGGAWRARSQSVIAFRFRLVIKTDLCNGTTAVEKQKLLTEHLRVCTGHTQPLCITGLAVFCDRSLFSQPPDNDGLVSIEVHGYVQANSLRLLIDTDNGHSLLRVCIV
jgi:hypothetical protein